MPKLLTKLKIFKDLLFTKITKKRIPLIANLLITNRCNLRCFYCYVDVSHRQLKDLTIDEILRIIDILHKNGTKIIVLLGGEPLLRDDIAEIIEYINKKSIICEVITNGYLAEKRIEALKLVDSVCVSLDGDSITHDLNRGKGSFNTAVNAIRLFKKNNINTRFKSVITKNNIDSLNFLAEFARKNRLFFTASIPVVYEKKDYGFNTNWLGNVEARQLLIKLRSFKKNGFPIGYSFKAINYCINWPHSYSTKIFPANKSANFNYIKCQRKDLCLYMDVDATIYPCAALWGQGGKNILKDGFKSAWNNFENYKCSCCGTIPEVDISLLLNIDFGSVLSALSYLKE